MQQRYSAIVVGGGHNGLVAANYLARSGAKVLVLERRTFVGGACVTEELFPGFRVSSCSYVCHMLQKKVIDDLELRKYGFEVIPLDPTHLSIFPDGQRIIRWHDDGRTKEEIGRISTRDADRLDDWMDFWRRAAGILHRHFLDDPPTLSEVASSLRDTADEPVFERMLTGNMKDLVEEYFESEQVRAAFIGAEDAGDIRAPGSIASQAYTRASLFTDHQDYGIPRGGMGNITQAMARAAEAHGAEIRTGAEIDRISVRNGRATGVVMADGQEIEADVVLSNADPKRTFLTMMEPGVLDQGFVRRVQRLTTNASYLKFHCSLRKLPDFSAYLGDDYDVQYLANIRMCPSVEYFERSWDDARHGRPSSTPVMHMQIPSVHDKSLTPPGKHVLALWALYAPVQLREGTWDEAREQVGEQLIDTVAQYLPDFRESIIDWELFTPLDLERRVYLTDGNIRHLDITTQQLLSQRLGYRTPVEGLYLCGAGTHPGGEVTGAPGHNAARTVLRDWEMEFSARAG